LLFALAGCGISPKERFYTLGAGAAPARVEASASYSIAVGPVTIPAIVDRPQLVLRTGANRVMLAEQSRWAEPLKDSIARVIAGDLAQLLHDARVSAHPQGMTNEVDYRVLIDVQRFESSLSVVRQRPEDVRCRLRSASRRHRRCMCRRCSG
jgi:hypothetical protein